MPDQFMSVYIVLCIILAILNMIPNIKNFLYMKNYAGIYKKFDQTITPPVSVFVPCKGAEPNLINYLQAMVHQDYPAFKIYFITESADDPAGETIRQVIEQNDISSHVIAGKAETCCQKNHNVLAAINKDTYGEILVFADADVKPSPQWLRDLILPITNNMTPMTTGFRWLTPKKFSFWGTLHSMLSAYLGTLMSSTTGMWGGSMAIRRSDFTKYNVGKRWSETVVDDISLTEIILKNKIKRIFVPTCIAVSSNVIEHGKELFAWFVRQIQYLKIYCKTLWLIALVYNGLTFFALVSSLVLSYQTPGLALLFFSLLLALSLCRFNYKDNQSFLIWLLLAAPAMCFGFCSIVYSGIQKDMLWRGITYSMNRYGIVTAIKR